MLAVVVLVPIAIMVVALLLERFEARAVSADAPPRTSRADLRIPRSAASHLSLVPDLPAAPRGPSIGLDAPTADLRKVS